MKEHRNEKGGFVLVSVVLLGVVLESFAAVSLIQQLQEIRMQRYNQMKVASFYVAQGGMERGLYFLADRLANFSIDQITPDQNYTITYSDGRTAAAYRIRCAPPTSSSTALSLCPTYMATEDGIQKSVQDVEIIVQSNHVDNSSFSRVIPLQASSSVHQITKIKKTSIFSYSVFYDTDLEVLPGANMTMTGKVHSNDDIYLGTHATLTVDSTSVHATGDFYHGRKDTSGEVMEGTVRIRKSGTSGACSGTTCPSMTFDSTSPTWAQDATTTWGGSVESWQHGVGYVQPVEIPSILPTGFYATNAGFKVIDGVAYNASGTVIPVGSGGIPVGTITEKTFRNYRENSSYDVIVTEIDIDKLNSSGYFPSNGLIYASRTNAIPAGGRTSSTSHGVRLVNGSQIGPSGYNGGLTVVTNNPLYVKGDFNTTNKKSVGLISDAMNLLSNNWSDANSALNLSFRTANDTTINAGFVSGIVLTDGSHYSGGLENYPRFLENWSSKNMNIGGAFINLWQSQIGTGQWIYGGNYYTAPVRNWAYDPILQSSPPPFTPVGVEIEAKNWWQDSKESIYL